MLQLGPEASEALAEVRAYVGQWQEGRRALAQDPPAEVAYANAVAAADRLHAILIRAAAERRGRMVELERVEAALIVGMVILRPSAHFREVRRTWHQLPDGASRVSGGMLYQILHNDSGDGIAAVPANRQP